MATVIARRPPGPKGGLLMGVMADFNRDSLSFIERCGREFGDVVYARFLYVPAIFLYHPDLVESVLVTNHRKFIKSQSLRSPFFRRLVGNGLVTSEGEFWRRQRRLSQPAFHRERIKSYAEVMSEYAERMARNWQDGETRDVHKEMTRLTQSIVVRTLFSSDVSKEMEEISDALEILVKPFESQASVKWILDNRLPTRGNRRFHEAARRLDRVIYRIINERRASGERRDDLLSMLLEARDEDGSQMSDQQLRDEVMTLFLAGYETTALALAWSFYLLSQNPEAEAKLHREVDEVLGERAPSMDDLPRLKYAEKVIKEAMRLYPPAYAVGRQAVEDCEIGGYRIKAKTQVFAFQWAIQRDARFYDEPERFLPERWTEEMQSRLPKYAYFPFGGGARLCIGASFAMTEAVLILATIAQRFRLALAHGFQVALQPAMSLRPRDGMQMTLHARA